jgi:Uncharacterized protein conserved in bacteria (DUF2188)
MASKTFHIYRSNGSWTVKKEGKAAKTFRTQREAIDATRKMIKKDGSGQFVVYGPNSDIRKHESYGMIKIQRPWKKSPIAKQISRAVGQVLLASIKSDSTGTVEHSPQK